jgi:hypothetical protein
MRLFMLVFLGFSPVFLFAQNGFSFRVTDAQKQPVEGATVFLLSAKDSSVVKTEISDAGGSVAFEAASNQSYLLAINALGFLPFKGGLDAIGADGTLRLASSGTQLETVTIAAKKPMFETRTDKLIFNVENSPLATGNTALELLRKSPGVIVDQNDNIALRGKNGVRIYIDGKPSPLGAADLAAQLQAMQASDIEAIEIIANPSARFDAAGNAGIINIKLKKNKNYGTNGTLTSGLTQGLYARGNANLSLNHRNRALNLFGSYGHNRGKNWNFFDFYRRQNGFIFDQKTESRWQNNNHNFKTGADWTPHKNHALGLTVNGFANRTNSNSNTQAPVYEEVMPVSPIQVLLSSTARQGRRANLNANLNYLWTPGKDRTLSADFDYGHYDLWADEAVPNRYVDPQKPDQTLSAVDFYSQTPTLIGLWSLKADWEQPLGKNQRLSAGLKSAHVRTDNTFNFFENAVFEPQQSNQFVYDEQINAAYGQISGKKGKLDWQIGLRAEQTISEGDLQTANEIADKNVRRNYLNWFPSASASLNLDAKNRLGLSYSRRIDRPAYADLNPFEYRINELTYSKGNPFLLPQYTHNLELNHTWNWTLNSSLSYSYVQNYFANVSDTVELRRSFLRKENFDRQEVWDLSSSYPFKINRWWSGFATATAALARYRADFEPGKSVRIDNYNVSTYLQNSFAVGRGLSLELSGSYSSPNIWGGTYRNRAFWFVDAGLQHKSKHLTLRLVVADLFLSMRWRGVAEFGGLYAIAAGGWDSRQLRLSATYSFGKSTVKKARQRSSATEELQRRAE